jgi:iron complex outermembrane receptor protein
MKLSRVMLLGTSVLVSCAVPALAHAQSTDAPPPPAGAPDDQQSSKAKSGADASAASGDIIVTGERNNQFGTDTAQSGSFRNAKILDIPMTVSVIPDALLKSQQAVDLIDAVRNTAGVSSSGVGPASYNNITIRGIAVDTRSSYKMDGTLNILSSTSFPLEDKDRVEILKGASAIYYGFSPPSGIVNFVMKRATPDLYIGVRGFGDANGGYGGHVDVGDTFGVFGFRINGVAAHQDTGITFAKGDRYLASGTFDVKPTSKLTLSADVEWFKRSIIEPATFIIPNGATKIPDLKYLDPSKNIGGLDWDANKTEELNMLFKGAWKFAKDWDVTAYWGHSRLTRLRYNPGFAPGRGLTPSATASTASYLAALDPTSLTFGQGVIRYGTKVQNALYNNTSYAVELHGKITTGDITNSILLGASRSLRSLGGSPATPRTTIFSNFTNPVIVPNPNAVIDTPPTPSSIDDKGLYAFDDLSYKNIIHLTGGVRVTDYTNDGSTNTVTKTPYHVTPTAVSAGVIVKPTEWSSLYGTYIQGLEENSIASNNVDNVNTVFAPISSKLYEAGLKLQPRKNLLIQLAYFDITRFGAYNERVPTGAPAGTQPHGYGDATQTYRGFEGSIGGYVIPDLAINATLMLLKARTRNPSTVNVTRPGGTPSVSWSLSGEYTLSWLTPDLKVSAGAFHTGNQAIDDTDKAFTDPYTTFDIGASYTFKVGQHSLVARVNGQNITNKRYWAAVGAGALAESLPGTVKFSLAFNY